MKVGNETLSLLNFSYSLLPICPLSLCQISSRHGQLHLLKFNGHSSVLILVNFWAALAVLPTPAALSWLQGTILSDFCPITPCLFPLSAHLLLHRAIKCWSPEALCSSYCNFPPWWSHPPPGFISHIFSDDSQFLSLVLISPLNSRPIYQLSTCHLLNASKVPYTQQGQDWAHDLLLQAWSSSRVSLSEGHHCLIAEAEAKEQFSPIVLIFITLLNLSQIRPLLSVSTVITVVQDTIISSLNGCNLPSDWSTCIHTSLPTYSLYSVSGVTSFLKI